MNEILQVIFRCLNPDILITTFLGSGIGILVGALPGLTSTMGVALAVPLTFGQPKLIAFGILLSVYVGSVYGGSIAAILINIPGTPAASATMLDGYPMAQKGKAGLAIGISTVSSFFGGIISVILLILLSTQLSRFGLKFSAQEYFALAFFGLTIIISVSSGSILKGLISGVLGLIFSTVGTDEISGYFRFTFNQIGLFDGISFIPFMIGIFAFSEIFPTLNTKDKIFVTSTSLSTALPPFGLIRKLMPTILRSSLIGTFIGVLPGAGAAIASFISYNEAKRRSKVPETFGKGNPYGIAAPESANNAVTGGAMIPLLSLAIPGDSVTAILLGAFLVHGLRPGPMLFVENKPFVIGLFIMMIFANVFLLLWGLLGAKFFSLILLVPKSIIQPIIITLAIVGSFAINNSMFDVYIMVGAGVMGYVFKIYKYPLIPLVLGLILGPIAETNFRRAMILSKGNYLTFLTRPISVVLIGLAITFLILQIVREVKYNKEMSIVKEKAQE